MKRLSREYENPAKQLWGQTLKVTNFTLELAAVNSEDYSPVSYMGREIKFIIHEFSLSRPLKKGKDVNKFVVNMAKDEFMQLGVAHYLHQTKVKAGDSISIDSFLKNECNLSVGTQYDSFKSVFYGENPFPEVSMDRLKCRDDSNKMPQLVTCIIDESYEKKNLNKGVKRRVIKKEVKQEAVKEEKIILKEEKEVSKDKENIAPAPQKLRRSKRTRKAAQVKPKQEPKEEKVSTPMEVKKEDDFLSTIEKILGYSKKPKSTPDMDFSDKIEPKVTKKTPIATPSQKKKKMSRFREYLEWYDMRTQSGRDSVQSKSFFTPLSTPAKISLRVSQRLSSAKKARY